MAQGVGGAVQPGRLAVPDAYNTIVGEFAEIRRKLGTLDRGGGQLLVKAGHESHVMRVEQFLLANELQVQRSQRGAGIAGNESRRAQAVALVHAVLFHGDTHDRLQPGKKYVAIAQCVTIFELHGAFYTLKHLGHNRVFNKPR